MWIPDVKAWEFSERHYGSLQSLDKQKETVHKFGKDQVLVWRRSYNVPPATVNKLCPHHPANNECYNGTVFPDDFTESLATTLDRVVLWFYQPSQERLCRKSKLARLSWWRNTVICCKPWSSTTLHEPGIYRIAFIATPTTRTRNAKKAHFESVA